MEYGLCFIPQKDIELLECVGPGDPLYEAILDDCKRRHSEDPDKDAEGVIQKLVH